MNVKLMRLFDCVTVEGDSWLVADMRYRCYDAAWGGFAVWAVVMITVYTAGLPIGIICVLRRHRGRLREPAVRERLGFLYEVRECLHR